MHRYIVTRLLLAIPTLAGAALLVFILMRLVPGDVCVIRLGAGGAHVDAAALKLCRDQLGLDNPIIVQFLDFLKSYVTFDFGKSMWSSTVFSLNAEMVPSGMASRTAMIVAISATSSDTGRRSRISCVTGLPDHMDLPKSNVT